MHLTSTAPAPTATDDVDGSPTWAPVPGTELVPGHLAWERLGVGERCETWLAWHAADWCPVVVKVARPHQVGRRRTVEALAREARALLDVHHPGLPVLRQVAVDASPPHLVLQYLDGPTLAEAIDDDGPLPPAEVLVLGSQLLASLVPVHSRGLAHLDAKSENVVLVGGLPVLVDLGSARPMGSAQPAGRPVGTVGYAPPEMERCEPVSAAMDVFGVGATLVEALTGHAPTAPDSVWRLLAAHAPRTPLDNTAVGVLAHLTADRPEQRPTLGDALDLVVSALPVDLRPWPAWAGSDVLSRSR